MPRNALIGFLFAFGLILAGAPGTAAAGPEAADKSPEERLVMQMTDELTVGDYAGFQKHLTPEQAPNARVEVLQKLRTFIPPGKPERIRTIGSQYFTTNRFTRCNLALEYSYPGNKFLLIQSRTLLSSDGALMVEGYNLNLRDRSLEDINRFRLSEQGGLFYLAAALGLASVCTCVAAFIVCIRTRPLRRKWLWAIICLLGLVTFSVNTVDGAFGVMPANIQLLGFGVVRYGYVGPWMVNASLPLGAIIFLLARKRLMAKAAETPAEVTKDAGSDAR